jgi:hypothetical protein
MYSIIVKQIAVDKITIIGNAIRNNVIKIVLLSIENMQQHDKI